MRRFLFLALFIGGSLYAALPPYYQSAREIEAILADSKLSELLGSADPIQEIIKTDDGYLILTRRKLLRISVQYIPTKLYGPASFKLEFQEPVDLRK